MNAHVAQPFRSVLNRFTSAAYERAFPKRPAGMALSIWHYKLRAEGNAGPVGGCCCRGCMIWHRRGKVAA